MMTSGTMRGQPIMVLALLLGAWAGFRILTWQAPALASLPAATGTVQIAANENAERNAPAFATGDEFANQSGGMSVPDYWPQVQFMPPWSPGPDGRAPVGWLAPAPVVSAPVYVLPQAMVQPHPAQSDAPMLAAGHQLMWMAALARMSVPQELSNYVGQSVPAAPSPVPMSPGLAQGKADRWSADAWMLMRQQAGSSVASSRPLYGGSQIGAVLRYRLDTDSKHRPTAYLRGSSALGGIRESEVALGLGARPIAGFPLVVAGEARAFRSMGDTSFRPAAIAYTELQPKELPMELLAEAYLQGGYVGGKFATPFIDGQLRLDRPLGKIGPADVRVGAGVWGGAQKGASRLDVGPGATARLKLMGRPSRVSMDYRFRVAGDAEPGSGPAVTVSTGF